MRIIMLSAACLLANSTSLYAQFDNDGLKEKIPVDSADDHWLKLRLVDDNFLKNNEYFNSIMVGQTYFGIMLHPSLTWNPNKYMRLQAGVFMRKDFGNPDLYEAVPTFTLKMQKNGYAFLFGTLEGTLNHNFIQPLYDFERYISDPIEEGAQITIDKPRFKGDIYIDWQHYEYPDVPGDQEIINSGFTATPVLFEKKRFKISLPVQAIILHHGGQLEQSPLPHNESLLNYAVGFSASYTPASGIITEIRSENYYVHYQDLNTHFHAQWFNAGHGTYLNLLVKSKFHVDGLLSSWYGHDFVSGLGGYLYESVSRHDLTYREPWRKLIFFSLMYEQQWIPGLSIAARMEPYYNIRNTHYEYSYSFYAVYRAEFRLKKLKASDVTTH